MSDGIDDPVQPQAAPDVSGADYEREVVPMLVAQLTQFLRGLSAAGCVVAPPEAYDSATIEKLATTIGWQQLRLAEFMATRLTPERCAEFPLIGLEVTDVISNRTALFPAYKTMRLDQVNFDPQLVVTTAVMLGFMLSPVARGVLLANGFTFRILELREKDKPQPPKIVA
jgi:hypothetical protein